MKNSQISVKNLTFYYNQNKPPILKSVNIDIIPGDYLLIMGPNGSGKTTLLKILLGLLTPDSGRIEYHGVKPTDFGYVPQFTTYDRNIPILVKEFVAMGVIQKRRILKRPVIMFKNEIEIQLKQFNLTHLAESAISDISGGELQRTMLARAMIQKPKILFLDEPTTYIDSESRGQLSHYLDKLNDHVSIVMVTHDTSAVSDKVRHIACVNQSLYYHRASDSLDETLTKVYGCPIELLAHGKTPHRVLKEHE